LKQENASARAGLFSRNIENTRMRREKGISMDNNDDATWRRLAEAIQQEQDPAKVLELAERLNRELAKEDAIMTHRSPSQATK
jgi:hypothetical protein